MLEAIKLLAEKCDIQALNKNKESVLDIAAANGHDQVVEFLLKRFDSVGFPNKANSTEDIMRQIVDTKSEFAILTHIKNHPEAISYKDDVLNSLLHTAASYNWIKLAEFLLQSEQIDINDANILNVTPLMVAADNLCKEVANMIWRSGADITVTNTSGKTAGMIAKEKGGNEFSFLFSYQPLFDAVEQDNVKMVSRSVNSGNVNTIINMNGDPLLHHSCVSKDRYNVFEYLINIGADVNSLNRQYMTPIMVAVESKAIRQFVKLMEKNPDLSCVDKKRRTVLSIAIHKKLPIIIKSLQSRGAPDITSEQQGDCEEEGKRKHRPGARRVKRPKVRNDEYAEQRELLKMKINEARTEAEEIAQKLENNIEIEIEKI